jgi:hypothetical protein
MGAINTETGNHVYPAVALKGQNYKCPECEKPVIFRNGKIKAKHFAHKANSNCSFYDHPNESQLHREAKRQMCTHLNNKRSLIIQRKCLTCPRMKEYELSNFYTESCCAKEEHNFDYNNSKYSADVALLDNNKILLIIEILHTHQTEESRRPEPWVEVKAIDVINQINSTGSIPNLNCMRNPILCESCGKKQIEQEQKRIEEEKKQKEEIERQHQIWLAGADERAERQKKWLAEADERAEKEKKRIQEKEEKEKKIAADLERRQRSFEERQEREKKLLAEAAIRKEEYDKNEKKERNDILDYIIILNKKDEQEKTINPPQT